MIPKHSELFTHGCVISMTNAIQLHEFRIKQLSPLNFSETKFFKISLDSNVPEVLKSGTALVQNEKQNDSNDENFGAYLYFENSKPDLPSQHNNFVINKSFSYLNDGDVIKITANGDLQVIYRKNIHTNFLTVTETCNSFCLMCSQPPKKQDDSYHIDEYITAVKLFDRNSPEVMISGGEPTLMGDKFFLLLNNTSDSFQLGDNNSQVSY